MYVLEELVVSASAHFVQARCFKTAEDHARKMLFCASLREESAEHVGHIEDTLCERVGSVVLCKQPQTLLRKRFV